MLAIHLSDSIIQIYLGKLEVTGSFRENCLQLISSIDCIVIIILQRVELRLQGVEAVGFIRNFLLGTVELSLEFLEAWVWIVNGGVVVDNDGVALESIAVVIGYLRNRGIREFCTVKVEGDGLPGKDLSLGLKPDDNVLYCRIEAESEVVRVELASVDIEGESSFDVG